MHYYDERVRYVVIRNGYYWQTVGVATTLHFAKTIARRFLKKHKFDFCDLRIYEVEDLYKCLEADSYYVPRARAPYWYLDTFGKWILAARGYFSSAFECVDDDDC